MPAKRRTRSAATPAAKKQKPDGVSDPAPATDSVPSVSDIVTAVLPAVTAGVVQVLRDMRVIPETPVTGPPATSSTVAGTTSSMGAGGIQSLSQGMQAVESRPLSLGLDPQIRAKIVADQFVELDLLIRKVDCSYSLVEQPDGHLTVSKNTKSGSEIRSLDQWFRAFHIFISVYVDRHPSAAAMLMKHCNTVQQLARQSGDHAAIFYDRQFRLMKESAGPLYVYGHIDLELYTQALAKGISKQNQPFHAPKHQPRVQKPCFAFNGGACTRKKCKFMHKCQKCNGTHPKTQCKTPDSNKPKSR